MVTLILNKALTNQHDIAKYQINIKYKSGALMLAKETLHKEIDTLPDEIAIEILDFIHFLKTKHVKEKMEVTVLSESSLVRDWLSPEEDEAWQNL